MLRYVVTLFLILGAVQVLRADDDEIELTPKGYGSFEIGQIGHGYYRGGASQFNNEISHIWQQRALANFGFNAQYKEFLTIDLIGEGMMAFSNPQVGSEPTTMQPRQFFYIKSSNATLSFLDPEYFGLNPGLFSCNVQVGYFPYKYNSDVRNLGEYLFRSLPYPLVIYADFDYPQATLLGLKLNTTLLDTMFSNDLILHSETVVHPVQNWSISDVAEANLFKTVTIGGGVSLYHIFSAYSGKNIVGSVDGAYYWQNLSEDERATLDTTIDYSAMKVMLRMAVDGKPLLKLIPFIPEELFDFFGEDDMRAYGEWDLLGTKNYEGSYESAADRTILTLGFNLPGFKIIDVINYEMEFCPNGTAFSDARFYNDKPSLLPDSLGNGPTGTPLERATTRWSWYAKKSLFNKHFSVIAQIARDHKKINFYYFDKKYMSFRETLPTKEDWWWAFKTEYLF